MAAIDIINAINNIVDDRPAYIAYNFANIAVMFGTPPMRIRGLEYVFAKHNYPQKKRFGSLNTKHVFLTNRNRSGIIEFGLMDSCFSVGAIQAMQLTGIPMPIAVTDLTTGGTGSVVASACMQVGTPEWRKGLAPSLSIFTFECASLTISNGVRLTV